MKELISPSLSVSAFFSSLDAFSFAIERHAMREPILKLFFARTRSDGIFRCAFARIFKVSAFLVSTNGDIRARFRRCGFSSFWMVKSGGAPSFEPNEREKRTRKKRKLLARALIVFEHRRLKTHTHARPFCLFMNYRHSSIYNSQPPPDDDDNFWGWLTGEEGRRVPASSANYATGITEDDDTFNWLANQANYYAGELSRNVKSMTDAIAEELLGPAEDEEGEEIEEEDESVRGDGHVVAGGATLNASRRGKVKDEKPKMKPKKKKTPRELEEEDDPLGGFLELLGLEDEEEEEYVRRDSKKDK